MEEGFTDPLAGENDAEGWVKTCLPVVKKIEDRYGREIVQANLFTPKGVDFYLSVLLCLHREEEQEYVRAFRPPDGITAEDIASRLESVCESVFFNGSHLAVLKMALKAEVKGSWATLANPLRTRLKIIAAQAYEASSSDTADVEAAVLESYSILRALLLLAWNAKAAEARESLTRLTSELSPVLRLIGLIRRVEDRAGKGQMVAPFVLAQVCFGAQLEKITEEVEQRELPSNPEEQSSGDGSFSQGDEEPDSLDAFPQGIRALETLAGDMLEGASLIRQLEDDELREGSWSSKSVAKASSKLVRTHYCIPDLLQVIAEQKEGERFVTRVLLDQPPVDLTHYLNRTSFRHAFVPLYVKVAEEAYRDDRRDALRKLGAELEDYDIDQFSALLQRGRDGLQLVAHLGKTDLHRAFGSAYREALLKHIEKLIEGKLEPPVLDSGPLVSSEPYEHGKALLGSMSDFTRRRFRIELFDLLVKHAESQPITHVLRLFGGDIADAELLAKKPRVAVEKLVKGILGRSHVGELGWIDAALKRRQLNLVAFRVSVGSTAFENAPRSFIAKLREIARGSLRETDDPDAERLLSRIVEGFDRIVN